MANESNESDLDIFEGLGKKSEKTKAAPPALPESGSHQAAAAVPPAPVTAPAPITQSPSTAPLGTSTMTSPSGLLNGAPPPAIDDEDATRVAMERPTLDLLRSEALKAEASKSDPPKSAAKLEPNKTSGPQFDSRVETITDLKVEDAKAIVNDLAKAKDKADAKDIATKDLAVEARQMKETKPEGIFRVEAREKADAAKAAEAKGETKPDAKMGDTMKSVPPPPGRSLLPAPAPPKQRQASQPPSAMVKASAAAGNGAATGLVDWDDDNEETHIFDKDKADDAPSTKKVDPAAHIEVAPGSSSKLVPSSPLPSVQPKKTLLGIAPPGAGAHLGPSESSPPAASASSAPAASASSAFDALSALDKPSTSKTFGANSAPPPPPGGGLFAHLSPSAQPAPTAEPPQVVTAPLAMPNPPPPSPLGAPAPAAGMPVPMPAGTNPLGVSQNIPPQHAGGYGSAPPPPHTHPSAPPQHHSQHPSHAPQQHSQHPSHAPQHHSHHPSAPPQQHSQHPSHAPQSMHPSHAPMVPGGRMEQTQLVRPKGPPMGVIALVLAGLFVASLLGVYFLMTPKAGTVVVKVADVKGGSIDRVEIFLDGKKQCDTPPCRMPDVTPGSHDIKVLATGYESITRQVTVEAGREVPLDIALAQSAGSAPAAKGTGVKVNGSQSGVRLFVDGKDIGPLPQEVKDLTAGDHTVKIAGSDRYQPLEKTVTVTKDEILDMGNTQLKVLRGKATIVQGTPGAKVYLVSGSERREVPLDKQNPIPVDLDSQKAWTLEATKAGMNDFKQPISFDDGQAEKTFTVTLEPKGAPSSGNPAIVPTPKSGGVPSFVKPEGTEPTTPKEPKTPKEPAGATGEAFLTMNSIPASTVLLDGKPIGQTPKVKVSVTPGPHLIVFVNAEQGVKKQMNVTVGAGETKVVAAKLKAE